MNLGGVDAQIGLEVDCNRDGSNGALSLIAGIILALVLGSQIKDATNVQNVTLSGGQLVLIAVINILAYAIGGFIVGVRSAGRTIIEPGISAAIAVLIALLISGNFTVVNLIAGGLIPFVSGVVGGWAATGDGLSHTCRFNIGQNVALSGSRS